LSYQETQKFKAIMNQHPQSQQHLEQPKPANQLLQCQPAVGKPEQYICTTAATPTAPTQLDPTTFLQYAGSLAAIIQGITLLVVALTKLSRVFVSLMPQKRDEKTEPKFRRKKG
jgi:hypothetical protein